jgi:death-on-curing protein
MITYEMALDSHAHALANSGGMPGVKDRNLVESAIARPFHSVSGLEPYPTVIDKSECLLHALLVNHGFNDANKRTAWITCNAFLYSQLHLLVLPDDLEWYEKLAEMVADRWEVQRVISWVNDYAVEFVSVDDMEEALNQG